MRRFIALFAVTALLLIAPASVRAASFFIDDTLPTEVIRFTASGFQGGLFLNGNLFQQGVVGQASADLPEGLLGVAFVHTFDGEWQAPGQPIPPAVQVAFIEPGTGLISDVLFVQYNQQTGNLHITGHFASDASEQGLDPAQYLTPGVPVTNWPETNGAFNFSVPFLSASANSDVEIPEPATLGLIAVGLGAIVRRRPAR